MFIRLLIIHILGICFINNITCQVRLKDNNINVNTFKIIKDIIIFKDTNYYTSFPSVIKKDDGVLLLVFRSAPDRRLLGNQVQDHLDPHSYIKYVESHDG